MEVHHHSHHPKNWKEYVTEFLMLFCAVFAGFLAESYLEYRTERHKEHDYLVSLVSDLKIDSADITIKAANMQMFFDKLIDFSNLVYKDDWMEKYADSAYILSEQALCLEITLQYADGTIDQLKNAGGFRLIKNQVITQKIKEYIKAQSRMKNQELGVNNIQETYSNLRNNLIYNKVFTYKGDVSKGYFEVGLQSGKLDSIKAKTGSKFLSNNQKDFVILANNATHYASVTYVYKEMAEAQKQKAVELIHLIEEEIN